MNHLLLSQNYVRSVITDDNNKISACKLTLTNDKIIFCLGDNISINSIFQSK
jgi:hypothetical protein